MVLSLVLILILLRQLIFLLPVLFLLFALSRLHCAWAQLWRLSHLLWVWVGFLLGCWRRGGILRSLIGFLGLRLLLCWGKRMLGLLLLRGFWLGLGLRFFTCIWLCSL